MSTAHNEAMPGIFLTGGECDRRFCHFVAPGAPCPTSTVQAVVKQLAPSQLNPLERKLLDLAFGGFLTETLPPGQVHAVLAETLGDVSHEDRLPRRYAGDGTLPPGRYFTLCNGDGDDGGTLARELAFYTKADVMEGHLEILDPFNVRDRDMIERLGLDPSARERLVLRLFPFALADAPIQSTSFCTSLPVEIQSVRLENVLDLRRSAALEWLWRTIPQLQMVVNETEFRCFPFRPELGSLGELLPSLFDQQRGGGNFDKVVGLYLRHLGVAGLVFPAARGNSYVVTARGEPTNFSGWSVVVYSGAARPDLVGFYELRPDWPRTLTLEGGDDNVPEVAAFADEFRIVMTEGYPSDDGGFAVEGMAERMHAYRMMDSWEAAVRFRLPHVGDADIAAFKTFAVSLSARSCAELTQMALWSLLGNDRARTDLHAAIDEQLSNHPVAALLAQCLTPRSPDYRQAMSAGEAFFLRLLTAHDSPAP